ncbi:NADP-dependent oxidoreductase [Emcibacter sp. SYSU 3D8]|uniref:NADP-dependent oxidoreductase n=1 Tax=Emcibacter sp. SYSU 3D8 TaxID=3133969 RepID=UPI0031FE7A4B
MTNVNRQWVVADAAGGNGLGLTRDQFEYCETTVPEIGDGEMLVRSVYFSCDPMNHAWVKGMEERFKAIPVGAPMCGGVAGRVVQSRHPDFKPGDAVTGFMEFADYVATGPMDRTGTALQRIPEGFPLASGLATLGMNGLCAYFGMSDIGHVLPGDTVVVSGAAGAIGSVAGQLAKLSGAQVIGIAGGAKKCTMLTDDLGFDAAIDYKSEDVMTRMAALCPEGIDVFFDNVGGAILDAALANMAHGGRIVICGGIATYNAPGPGLQNHMALAMRGVTMAGFFFFDYIARFDEGVKRLGALLKAGKIKEVLDVAEGFDAYPDAALGQFLGRNIGKQLVKVADDPGQ